MALGDVGPFLPAESNYGTPGAYDKMLQAEALKRAAFLSNMDQFYENLEEATRQFDETLSFKTETRDLELDWAREKHTKDLAFERERLEAEKTYNEGMLGLREREIAGDEGSELTSFERFKLFNMLEGEAKSRQDTRESALEPRRAPITPGSFWETGQRREETGAPRSGEVSTSVSGRYNPYDPSQSSASNISGGRQAKDNPNWIPPEFSDRVEEIDNWWGER